jgi:hypothetical protein
VRHAPKGFACALAVVASICATFTTSASADRATVSWAASDPWNSGDAIVTPLEWLASKIASRIAGHRVTVRCQTAATFRSIGGADDAGFVETQSSARTDKFARTANIIQLTSTTCGPLQRFAQAALKPTRCRENASAKPVPCFVGAPTASGATGSGICTAGRCYRIVRYKRSFWSAYAKYSGALETLAHEAIHTQQAVEGRTVPAPDQIETEADCWGMQWMPWVAEQFGDSPDDAQAIADYFWLMQYPSQASLRTKLPYWSSDCQPGGALDIRPADSAAWP